MRAGRRTSHSVCNHWVGGSEKGGGKGVCVEKGGGVERKVVLILKVDSLL